MTIPKHPAHALLFLTIRLGRLVTNRIDQQLEPEDQSLIGPHIGVLHDLYHKDGVRQQDLAISSIKDKATIARALKSLEEKALVVRTADPVDRRTKRIYITPKGRKTIERIKPVGIAVMEEAQMGVPEEELAACQRVLQQLYDNLNQ